MPNNDPATSIAVKISTRQRIMKLSDLKETCDQLINRALDALEAAQGLKNTLPAPAEPLRSEEPA